MKKLLLIPLLAISCQKQYNCRCFIETPTKRTPQKDSLIKSAGYQEANLECQKKNRQLNDSTDKVCDVF